MTKKDVGTPRTLEEAARLAKNARIASSQRLTRERRKTQQCRVIDCKILSNKLSASQKEALTRVFIEAKWLYNHALASDDVFAYTPGKTVDVKTPQGMESREYVALGSQMKQSVVAGIRSSIKTLATLKKRGAKVGRLRFISDYTSLELKQYGTTYRIRGAKARIQNIPGWVRIRGAQQLEGMECANARLVKKIDGYHLLITCFEPKDPSQGVEFPGTVIGVDFGVKTAFTLSNGEKIDFVAGETERLKKLQRSLRKKKQGSNNYFKVQSLIDREYVRIVNRRDNAANKVVHSLMRCEAVIIQDENIAGWRHSKGYARGGRKIQAGILGRVKQKLMAHPRTIVIPRYAATTATCVCGAVTKHGLDARVFHCSECG